MLGYQIDVSRRKVPTMETLYRIVDIMASLGYNQFQLYTEHTFAYKGHETVWCEASPMTPDEVRARLRELVADVKALRYVRLLLKDFEGEARPHWETFRQMARGSGTRILDEIDMRPAVSATAGLKKYSGMRLQKVPPRDMAEQKLKTSNKNFSAEEIAAYLALFDEVATEAEGGVA